VLLLPGLVACLVGVSLFAAVPALAATGDLAGITTDGSTLSFVLRARDLPADASIDTGSVRLALDGTSVDADAVPVGEAAVKPRRRVVLTIDTSGSMSGSRLQAAKDAAVAFLDAAPADAEVGLVLFNDAVVKVVQPTTDRAAVRAEVDAAVAVGDTALYDAAIAALDVLGSEGLRSFVLLSDGANDTTSPTTLAQAAQRVAAAQTGDGVDVTIVSIGTTPELRGQLDTLAAAAGSGRGQVVEATDLDEVASRFEQAGKAIAQQLVITTPVTPELFGRPISITVSARADDGSEIDASASYLMPPAPSTPGPTEAPNYGPRPVALPSYPIGQEILPVALVAIFAGAATILAIALMAAVRTDTAQGRISRRLSLYTLTGRQLQKKAETTSTTVFGSSAIARSAVELAGRVVARPKVESALAARLDSAGLLLKPAEWTLIQIGSGLFGALLLLLLSGGGILATLLGLALGLVGPQLYLVFQRSRREDAFLAQLPETLQLMAGSLSVGYSLSQAVDTVVREGSQPVSGEFNRALVQTRLGMPVEDALEAVASRFRTNDMNWAVMAIRIQREVGGNLSEVLTNVAGTLRERERLHRQVKVLSAEGRLSAWILGAMPVVFTLYLVLVRPEYLQPLYTTTLGWLLIVMACILFLAGVLWLRKVVKVQV
jgi:tight adherence protein B